MEAVLERPLDEVGVPEWDEAEYQRQLGSAGIPEPGGDGGDEPPSLSVALGAPASFDDLWPGHVYLPPRLLELETMVELANSCDAKLEEKDYFGSAQDAALLITPVVRRVGENNELIPLTEKEVKAEFDVWELRKICHFILQDQGLEVKDVQGKSPSGRLIGVKNFHSSAATTEPTTSPSAENSPSPS